MSKSTIRRPWFVSDTLTESYIEVANDGGSIELMQKIKAFRIATVNFFITVIAGYGIFVGGDPTILASLSIIALGALNGIELSEWIAAKQAISEVDNSNK